METLQEGRNPVFALEMIQTLPLLKTAPARQRAMSQSSIRPGDDSDLAWPWGQG